MNQHFKIYVKWLVYILKKYWLEREVRLEVLVKKTEELTKNADIIFKYSRNVHRATRGSEFRFGGKVLILSLVIFAILSLYIYYQIWYFINK